MLSCLDTSRFIIGWDGKKVTGGNEMNKSGQGEPCMEHKQIKIKTCNDCPYLRHKDGTSCMAQILKKDKDGYIVMCM